MARRRAATSPRRWEHPSEWRDVVVVGRETESAMHALRESLAARASARGLLVGLRAVECLRLGPTHVFWALMYPSRAAVGSLIGMGFVWYSFRGAVGSAALQRS